MEAAVSGTAGREGTAAAAATIAEAFRITAAQRAQEIAIRTKDDAFTITWGELRERVDALAGGLHGLGLRRGDTLALMIGNRPEFHLCDIAAMMVGAAPFSIYSTYTAEQIAYLVGDAEARILICEQQYLDRVLEARASLPRPRARDRDRRRGARGHDRARRRRGLRTSDFDVEASVAQLQSTDVLTLIYTSGTTGPAEGRAADPPQPDRGLRGPRGADRVPARRPRDLVAALGSHRRAQRPPLPADRLRAADHLLRGPAPGALLPARSTTQLVLRGAPHLGEAQGRSRDDDRLPAGGAAGQGRGGARGGDPQGAPRAGGGGGSRGAGRAGRAGRQRRSSRDCARCSVSTRSRRSTSALRRRPSRCSSSSTRSACPWPSCGA